jgi:hypothetical protein
VVLPRFLVMVAVVAAVFVVATPALRSAIEDARKRLPSLEETDSARQGASQISSTEFAQMAAGMTPQALRTLVGEPENTSTTRIEGLELECWYYGIVGSSGAYQFCFTNGQLSSKLRFARR